MNRNPRFDKPRRWYNRLMRKIPGVRYGMFASIARAHSQAIAKHGDNAGLRI